MGPVLPTILVVDDDVTVLRHLQHCLADMADLRAARTAEAGLRLARQSPPDMFVLDMHLEDMDGIDLLKAVRSDARLSQIPVMFLSGDTSVLAQVAGQNLGVADWIEKPVDERRLRARIAAALKRQAPLPASTPDAALRRHADLAGACVLAVDDDSIALDALRHALSPGGLQFCAAASAAEAMVLLDTLTPDVVILDVGMPEVDGFELAQRLMAMPALADTPIIFVTQLGQSDAEIRALEMGAFDFVSKPFQPTVLRARVFNAIRLRRRALAARLEVEDQWRRISGEQIALVVGEAQDPILVLDARHRIVLSNRAAQALGGPGELDRAGTSLPDWLKSALPERLLTGQIRHLSNVTITREHLDQEGVFDISASILQQESSHLLALTLHDQTQRIQVELQERAIIRSRAENQTRQLMMSYLLHEVGNPLMGIAGLTDLLCSQEAGPLNPEQARLLDVLSSYVAGLRRLMRDAIDISNSGAGHFTVKCNEIAVYQLLESAATAIEPMAKAARITIKILHVDKALRLNADHDRVRQCLDNLLSNACKYGVADGSIRIMAHQQDGLVHIVVEDDGQGMSPDDLKGLFVPFERMGRQGPGGHGLGMTVTKMLIEAMHGKLSVRSEPGAGTVFTIMLPLVPPMPDEKDTLLPDTEHPRMEAPQ